MIDRTEALIILKKYRLDDTIIKHSIAVEAIMENLAKHLSKNEEIWKTVGLLHDLDYEYTKNKPEEHGERTAEILENMLPEEGINAIKAHNYIYTKYLPSSSLDKSLIASDSVTDLIIKSVQDTSSKKISDLKIETLIEKLNNNSFIKENNRKKIYLCIDIGIDIKKFLEISLNSLKKISDKLDM